MALYYVHVDRHGAPILEDGIEYPDLATARAEIARTAVERLRDRVRKGATDVTIYVTDATGRELFAATARVELTPAA